MKLHMTISLMSVVFIAGCESAKPIQTITLLPLIENPGHIKYYGDGVPCPAESYCTLTWGSAYGDVGFVGYQHDHSAGCPNDQLSRAVAYWGVQSKLQGKNIIAARIEFDLLDNQMNGTFGIDGWENIHEVRTIDPTKEGDWGHLCDAQSPDQTQGSYDFYYWDYLDVQTGDYLEASNLVKDWQSGAIPNEGIMFIGFHESIISTPYAVEHQETWMSKIGNMKLIVDYTE